MRKGDFYEKKIVNIVIIAIMVILMGTIGFADNSINYEIMRTQNESEDIQTRADGVTSWKVISKEKVGTVNGAWETGPEHKGPVVDTFIYKKYVNVEISGSYTSKSTIFAALNIELNGREEVKRAITLIVPKGLTHRYKFGIVYDKYKITEKEYYRVDGYDTFTGKTKVSYVNKPVNVATTYTVIR